MWCKYDLIQIFFFDYYQDKFVSWFCTMYIFTKIVNQKYLIKALMRYVHMHVNIKINYNEKINKSVVNVVFLMFLAKAGEREGGSGGGGQNT